MTWDEGVKHINFGSDILFKRPYIILEFDHNYVQILTIASRIFLMGESSMLMGELGRLIPLSFTVDAATALSMLSS